MEIKDLQGLRGISGEGIEEQSGQVKEPAEGSQNPVFTAGAAADPGRNQRLMQQFARSRMSIGSKYWQDQIGSAMAESSREGLGRCMNRISRAADETDAPRREQTSRSLETAQDIIDNGTKSQRATVARPLNQANDDLETNEVQNGDNSDARLETINKILDTLNSIIELLQVLIDIFKQKQQPPVPGPAPTPEPEPQPSPDPQPQPQPAPTPQPEPCPAPQPTPAPAPTPAPEPTPAPTPAPTPGQPPVKTPAEARQRLTDLGLAKEAIDWMFDKTALRVANLSPEVIHGKISTLTAKQQIDVAKNISSLSDKQFETLSTQEAAKQGELLSLPQAELKAKLDELGGKVPVPPDPVPPAPQPPTPPAPQPAPDPAAARARLTEVGFAQSTVKQITDAAALRLVILDESVLKDVAKQNAANERAFARKIEGLPQDAFDKLGKLPATEQLRISKLTSQQMIEELAKVKIPSLHLTLGNPTGAVTDVNNPENYLMEKDQYALSYNRDKGEPNWTSWHLDSSDLGPVKRQNDFRPDPDLPEGWYRVTGTDYSGSGYTRGHMTPSGDRTSAVEKNSEVFLMTNMIPQAAGNNAGPWNDLEVYSRELAKQGNELYIVSGGYGSKGTIANGKVNIPERTWKVIVVLPKGENDLARITQNTRVIAVDMPNTEDVKGTDWKSYRTSVDAIEKATGYDFLSNVSTVIQNVIESRVDSQS